jgi:thiosulfate/3-mercaptopyruvate sulfurtransferase
LALISAGELAAALDTGDAPVLLDVRGRLGAPDPHGEYVAGHLPGAVYVDLDTELAAAPDPELGRHPLPPAAELVRWAARWGVTPASSVVVYDDNHGMSAARAWWLLRWIGHTDVRVLDGGLAAWRAAGGPLVTGDSVPAPAAGAPIAAHGGHMPTVDAGDILDGRVDVLLDVRAAERFRGEHEPVDPVAGHIPGARNVPTSENLAPDGRFLPAAELRRRFQTCGVESGRRVAVYCGSGVTATHTVLALALAGHRAALYPGSWSGWIGDPDRAIATDGDKEEDRP